MKKKDETIEAKEEVKEEAPILKSELEELHELFKELKERGFNSIGDVENRIAFLQK